MLSLDSNGLADGQREWFIYANCMDDGGGSKRVEQ